MGEIKFVAFFSWQENLMVSARFLSKVSLISIISSCKVLVSLFLYCFILYTHIEILPVLVSDGSSKFVSLF